MLMTKTEFSILINNTRVFAPYSFAGGDVPLVFVIALLILPSRL